MEEFNSELDIYSEIDSAYFKANSPTRRKNTLTSPVKGIHMRPVAEDSEEDRGSLGSAGATDEEENEEEEEEEDEPVHEAKRESAMDEREQLKHEIKQREATKKDEEELCGPKLMKKIDEFMFQVSVEAGLADPTEELNGANATMNATQDMMLQTGNTSLFQLEQTKNTDQGVYQKCMDKYVNEFRGQQAFFKLCKMAKDARFTDPNLHNPQFDYYN